MEKKIHTENEKIYLGTILFLQLLRKMETVCEDMLDEVWKRLNYEERQNVEQYISYILQKL